MLPHVRALAPILAVLVLSRAWSIAVVLAAAAIEGGHVDLEAAPLFGWDGVWYARVAADGYHAAPVVPPDGFDVAFFPLWPAIIRVASLGIMPLDVTTVVAGTLLFIVAGVLIHRLFLRFADPKPALLAVALWAFAPPAYVASIGYAEPAFAIGATAFFLERLPVRQFGIGVVAMLVRLTGLALVPAALLMPGRRWLAAAPLIGMAAWVGWLAWMSGDPLMYLKGSPSWYGDDAHGLEGLWLALIDADWYRIVAVVLIGLLAAGALRIAKVHLPLAVFSLACIGMTVLTAIPESMPRHAWSGFGSFLGLALLCPGRGGAALFGLFALAQGVLAVGALWVGLTP